MRSVYIAASLLLSIIILIVINSIYVLSVTDKLLSLCDEIKEKSSPAVELEKLLALWQSCSSKLSLSTNHNEIDRAENALLSLYDYYLDADAGSFYAQLSVFQSTVEHIAELARVSFHNIF